MCVMIRLLIRKVIANPTFASFTFSLPKASIYISLKSFKTRFLTSRMLVFHKSRSGNYKFVKTFSLLFQITSLSSLKFILFINDIENLINFIASDETKKYNSGHGV